MRCATITFKSSNKRWLYTLRHKPCTFRCIHLILSHFLFELVCTVFYCVVLVNDVVDDADRDICICGWASPVVTMDAHRRLLPRQPPQPNEPDFQSAAAGTVAVAVAAAVAATATVHRLRIETHKHTHTHTLLLKLNWWWSPASSTKTNYESGLARLEVVVY